MKAVLVYQAGIANVFRVATFAALDVDAQRLAQSDFHTCEAIARGMAIAGAEVRIASCNRAGDIREAQWTPGLSDCPFREAARPPRVVSAELPIPLPPPVPADFEA